MQARASYRPTSLESHSRSLCPAPVSLLLSHFTLSPTRTHRRRPLNAKITKTQHWPSVQPPLDGPSISSFDQKRTRNPPSLSRSPPVSPPSPCRPLISDPRPHARRLLICFVHCIRCIHLDVRHLYCVPYRHHIVCRTDFPSAYHFYRARYTYIYIMHMI
jgi:hypothetical protein